MGRRKNSALLQVAMALPWWVSLALACLAYLLLSAIARIEITPQPGTQNIGFMAIGGLITTLAYFGQYLVPFLLSLAALLSAAEHFQRSSLFTRASIREESIADMSWREFEKLVGEAFTRQGYRIKDTPPGPDGGVDIRMTKNGVHYLVQCKHYKASRVSVSVVRELYGVMTSEGADGGLIVTSGRFTRDALSFGSRHGIRLIDGPALNAMIKGVTHSINAPHEGKTEANSPLNPPDCPGCGATMIKRTARRGVNRGQSFWGCSVYPRCKSTLPLAAAYPQSKDSSGKPEISDKPLNWWQQ